jgi:hypothetical protein
MKLNRQLQFQILEHLKSVYPQQSLVIEKTPFAADPDFFGNVVYLNEQGLLTYESSSRQGNAVRFARITARGLDFLEDDGGVSQILRTVRVKIIEAHDFIALLEKKVAEAELPDDQKRSLTDKVKAFSTPVLQNLLSEVLKQLLAGWR